MKTLTTENMAVYVGGQVEIIGSKSNADQYHFRGQIAKIEVIPEHGRPQPFGAGQDAVLQIDFEYICEAKPGEAYKPSENKPYALSLLVCAVSDIGMGRLCVNSSILDEMAIFYPPSHNKRVLPDGEMKHDD